MIGNWFAWSVGQPLREISMSNLPNTNRNVSARNVRIWFDRRSFSDHFEGRQETVRLGNWPKTIPDRRNVLNVACHAVIMIAVLSSAKIG